MKMFKRTLTLLLAGLLTGSCFAGMTFSSAAEKNEYSEGVMPGSYTHIVKVAESGIAAYRVKVNCEFIAFSFANATWTAKEQYCTLSIYEWDTSCEKTLQGEPIKKQKLDIADNSTNRLDLDEPLPAGDYLFCLSEASPACGVKFYKDASNPDTKGQTYLNNGETLRKDIRLSLVVYTTDENYVPGRMFGENDDLENPNIPRGSANALGDRVANAAYEVAIGWSYGYRAKINYAFNAFDFKMPTWTAPDGYCSLALYKWDTNYETTIAGEPITTKRFDPMKDNARNKLEFDTQPAGEYLFYVYDTSYKTCGIYVSQVSGFVDPNGFSYISNLQETNTMIPDLIVYTPEAFTGELFGKCEPQIMNIENSVDYKPLRDKAPTYSELLENIIFEAPEPTVNSYTINQEYYDMLAASGIDSVGLEVANLFGIYDDETLKQLIEYATNAGLFVNISTPEIRNTFSTMNPETIYSAIDKYFGNGASGAIHVTDEPWNPNEVVDLLNIVQGYSPETYPHVNLLSDIYHDGFYYDRLDDFCRLLTDRKGMWLSFDHYPYTPIPGTIEERKMFHCLDAVREAGLLNGVNTANFCMSAGNTRFLYRRPTGEEIRYYVNASLAYGVKKIAYWMYGTPPYDPLYYYTTAVTDRFGRPTDLYYATTEIHSQTHAIGTTLVKLDALEVYHNGTGGFDDEYTSYEHIPENFFAKTDDYAILSLMKHKETGRNYLMVVNKDFTNAQEISINFSDVDVLKEISNENGEEIDVAFENGVFTRTLEAGAAVLLALPEGKDYTSPEETTESDNLLLNVYATASYSQGYEGYFISRVNDGVTTPTDTSKGWKTFSGKNDAQWLQFDLGEVKGFDRLVLYPGDSASERFFPKNVTLLTSDDGENWTTVTEKSMRLSGDSFTVKFDAAFGRYVRVEFDGLTRDTGNGNKYTCILGEVELYNDSGAVPPVIEDEVTTTPDAETTVPDGETPTPDGETTVAPDGETTVTPDADTTAAPEEGTAGADVTAEDTTAAEASGCKASLGAGIAAAALIAAAGAVVLKKKED